MNANSRLIQSLGTSSGNIENRRGAIAVLIALLMVIFLMSVAFSVDVAFMQLSRTRLRIATDAAARAAGESLTREQNLVLAIQAARQMAAANPVAGEPLLLDDSDIVTGNSARGNDGTWVFTAGDTPINSLRITGRRTQESLSGSIPLFFARIFNVADFETSQTATVVRMDRDICIVVDRSSSMKLGLASSAAGMSTSDPSFCLPPDPVDSRWAALVAAVQVFSDELATTPQIEYSSLVSYASNYTNCSISNEKSTTEQLLTADNSLINTALQVISARVFNGGTNIAAGIENGIAVLTDANTARPYARKTMILMTDGYRTEGDDPVVTALQAKSQDIIIHTITFGSGANQTDMQAVAAATGGKHYHAPDAQKLKDIFREIALTLLVTLTE